MFTENVQILLTRDVNRTQFSRVPKKISRFREKIPERENFGKLRAVHRYKIPWQQCVSQRTPPDAGWSKCHFIHNTNQCLLI